MNEEKELIEEIDEQSLSLMEDSTEASSEILYEDISKRSENVKHFRMKNGTYMAAVYDKPVHTMDKSTGKFVDIAHRFEAKEDCYEAETDHFKARFPKKEGKRKYVTVEKGERSVSWRYIPTTDSHKKRAEAAIHEHRRASLDELPQFPKLKYEKTEAQTDLEYGISEKGVKENIILTKRPKSNIFHFELKLVGLKAILSEDKKSIQLYAENTDGGEPEFVIPPINMTDGAGVYSEAAHYELTEDENGTVMAVVIDPEWLFAEERLYPVTVDPQIYIYNEDGVNPWTMVTVKSNNTKTTSGKTRVFGYDGSRYRNRLFMKIALPEPPTGCLITDASLKLSQNTCYPTNTSKSFEVCGVTSDWNKDTISWTKQPTIDQAAADTFVGSQTTGTYDIIRLNITEQVKQWYAEGKTHGSLVLKAKNDDSNSPVCGDSTYYVSVYSDEQTGIRCPMIYFTYTSADSYADHQKYETFETGRAGTGSVNLFTGALTFTHSDIATEGKRLPLSIAHIYRTEYSSETSSNGIYGHGWILSAAQQLTKVKENKLRAIYRDAQGRRHYFLWNSDGTITDDAGLGLFYEDTCNSTTTTYCARLYDEKGNQMFFDAAGRLARMSDSNGNASTYSYTNGKLTTITDGSGRKATLAYNSDGLLSQITDHRGRVYKYSYVSGMLSTITYPDGDKTVFTYSSSTKKLTSITDRSGAKYALSYTKVSGKEHVASIEQVGTNDECGFKTTITYYSRSTVVTDSRTGLKMVYRMDENGRMVSSYEDIIGTGLTKGEMTATALGNYTTIINTHDQENNLYTGKYVSLSANISGSAEQFPNLLSNGSFGSGVTSWTQKGNSSSDGASSTYYLRGYKSYHMKGESKTKYISQNVSLDSDDLNGNILVATAWAKATNQVKNTSVSATTNAKFELRVDVTFDDKQTATCTEKFESGRNDWQYVAVPIAIDHTKTPVSAKVTFDYSNNSGECWISNVRLFSVRGNTSSVKYEEFSPSVTVDSIRKAIVKKDGRITTIDYENDKSDIVLSEIIDANNNTFATQYTYDSKHQLATVKDYRGVYTKYTYDSYGNVTEKRIYPSKSSTTYMREKTEYDSNGTLVNRSYDPRNNSLYTKYSYTNDLLTTKTEQNDQKYQYTYDDDNDEMTSVYSTVGSKTPKNEFQYSHGNLTQVTHNGYTYKFAYDGLGRNTSITAGGTTLVSLAYTIGANSTVKSTYGNGDVTVVTSDARENPIKKTLGSTVISTAEYDEAGKPVKLVDKLKKVCYTYKYNSDGNVVSVTETTDSGTVVENTTTYDEATGRVTARKYGAVSHTYTPEYEKNSSSDVYPDHTVVGVKLSNKFTDKTTRDSLGRVTTRKLTLSGKSSALVTDSYTYLKNSSLETNFVSAIQQTIGSTSSKLEYTYDDSGNIATVKKGGTKLAVYTYDGLNRLTREDNYADMRSYTWAYDNGGNITEKKVYMLSSSGTQGSLVSTIPYGYDGTWKDKLTSYNGNTDFTYDKLGNPTKYRGYTLTWTNVRRLASYGNASFTYGADGIRTSKTYNGLKTTYTLDGNRILKESNSSKTLIYYYGANGVIGFRYNGADYYYQKNLQGDVIAIYNASGVKQAEYQYDAWGKVLNVINYGCCSNIGTINPFRYRSYYYDVETKLYYLQTRYYDPEVGRFINSDSLEYLGDGVELSNYNLFAYCGDNPVNCDDPSGHFAISAILIGALIGAAIGFGATALADYSDDGEVFNGSVSAEGYVANTLVGGFIGGITGGVGSSTFTLSVPTFDLVATTIGTTELLVGTASVTISGAGVLAGAGILGGAIMFAKGSGPRMGHNQHEKQMWEEAMRQLNITDKDVRRRLHNANEKKPYAETLKELLKNLREILSSWE